VFIFLNYWFPVQAILLASLKPLATFASGLDRNKKLLILIYHRVLEVPDFMRPGEVDRQAFTWQMQLLANCFTVLSLPEALARVQTNSLPPRAVCITFDDGYADNYTYALPILKHFGLTATFFIASGYLDGGRMWNDSVIEAIRLMPHAVLDLSTLGLGQFDIATPPQKTAAAQKIIKHIKHLDFQQRLVYSRCIEQQAPHIPDDLMLTTEQLKALSASGMEIGGHTVTHPILATLPDAAVVTEIQENKLFLENLLGKPCRFFAYPNGKMGQDFLPSQAELVKACGYQAALSTELGVANSASDLWRLPRFTPWDKTPARFMFRMAIAYAQG